MSTCHDNALCDTILPITNSSVFGVYNPVKGVTVTKLSSDFGKIRLPWTLVCYLQVQHCVLVCIVTCNNDITWKNKLALTHFKTSTNAVPFVTAPNLSITFGLAAAGISSIAFKDPFDLPVFFFQNTC